MCKINILQLLKLSIMSVVKFSHFRFNPGRINIYHWTLMLTPGHAPYFLDAKQQSLVPRA